MQSALARLRFSLVVAAALVAAAASLFWMGCPAAIGQQGYANPGQGESTFQLAEPVQPAVSGRQPLPIAPSQLVDSADDLTPEERVNVAVYEACNRSVVNINTKVETPTLFLIDVIQEGSGSGSVLDKQGHILTNYHVVEGAREVQATLFDGHSYDAKVVGRDASTDVCVLKIDAPPDSLYPVHFGDSTRLKVGQKVYALGNPFGLERTLTTGIVSSLNRSLPSRSNRTIKSIIQIDAAINPGNSGGPLLDTHGRLIGMNTAIATKTGQNAGVGFAIPASLITRVVPELIATGHVVRPETGISRVYETEKGLLVATLVPGGPAAQAGMHGFKVVTQLKHQGPFTYETQTIDRSAADLIIAVNGQPTLTADDFLSAIDAFHPGDEVTIAVRREGHDVPLRVRLSAGES